MKKKIAVKKRLKSKKNSISIKQVQLNFNKKLTIINVVYVQNFTRLFVFHNRFEKCCCRQNYYCNGYDLKFNIILQSNK